MATISKKDKLIEEAQKFVQRGQVDKAAKVYEQILALEPGAINQRQKYSELLIKCGRTDDARKELEAIGRHYSKNGFNLKAIAVFKQLQKLYPGDNTLSLTLAELNERLGLVANSLSEYKLVFEVHEKNGNMLDALDILVKMQNIDPQNVPIKIKLAEALIQQGKKDESFTLFTNAVSLLLERGDNASLSRVSTRIQHLFPDKPEFMLDVLSELVRGNKASIALNSLRSLLRTKPDNKRVWELIALAYQQLGQPQQLKIAYQHYLNYFPSEPAAILGLISCFAEEQNLAEALSLLDTYEATLISAGFIYQVEQIYTGLDKIDPINIRVLEGLIRVATAADNQDNVRTLTSKLQSLRTVTGLENNYPTNPAAQPAASNEQPFFVPDTDVTPFSDEIPSNDITIPGFDVIVYEDHSEDESDIEPSGVTGDAILNHEDNGMIDIEIDLDATFDALDHDIGSSAEPAGWFDSVEDLFDSIDTAPSGIKFGNDMDVSDAESHFDLGQAFKEMGLLDEAINEFRQSSQDPTRRVASLIMQCACLRERGELEKATSMLLALLKSGITEEESCAVKYELATGYELAGNKEEAATYLNEINASNPEFRDIRSRLDTAKHSDALDFSDEELKEFELK